MLKLNVFAATSLRSAANSADTVRVIAQQLESMDDKALLMRLASDLDAVKGAADLFAGDSVEKEDVTPLTDAIIESGLDIEKLKQLPFYADLVLAYKQDTFTIPEVIEFMTAHSTSEADGVKELFQALNGNNQ